MKIFIGFVIVLLIAVGCCASDNDIGSPNDRESLKKTSEVIRAAFARGDIEAIMACHHPDVAKALSYKNI
jgi:hypothetical protein